MFVFPAGVSFDPFLGCKNPVSAMRLNIRASSLMLAYGAYYKGLWDKLKTGN